MKPTTPGIGLLISGRRMGGDLGRDIKTGKGKVRGRKGWALGTST